MTFHGLDEPDFHKSREIHMQWHQILLMTCFHYEIFIIGASMFEFYFREAFIYYGSCYETLMV